MHIVFVTTELATAGNSSGGLASFTANMARIFAANGHRVTILLAAVKEEKLVFDDNIVLEVTYIKKSMWDMFNKTAKFFVPENAESSAEIRRFLVNVYKSVQVKRKIREINRNKQIDLIHYCNHSSLALWTNKHIPYVIRVSGFMNMCNGADLSDGNINYEDNKRSIKDKLSEFTLKKSKYIISPSNLLADVCRNNLKKEAVVIENPFVLNKSDWDDRIYCSMVSGKKYVIHYGSLRYLKGIHIVAQIVKPLLERHPGLYLVLAGNSMEIQDRSGQKIKADVWVKKCAGEYADRVIYAGRLVREQLYPLIQNAELCLLPSRIENLSNACIEAMAMGKIVVATNGASYEQLIDDRVSGFLCERDNPDSYLKAMEDALGMDSERKKRMIQRASERIALLRSDVIYEKYLTFYKKVISEWKH